MEGCFDPTFVELIDAGKDKIGKRMTQADTTGVSGAAKREFALAKTALEDAGMRYTRGLALITDRVTKTDLEKSS
jgi:hypothetical protein